MSTYVVTGGAGFIGSHVTRALLAQGHQVVVIDDLSTGKKENLPGGLLFLQGDIRTLEPGAGILAEAQYIIHLAALPSVGRSVLDPRETNSVNVGGTIALLEAARRVPGLIRFVYASSSSIYGGHGEANEFDPPDPCSPYALQKWTAERYCLLYHELYGLPTVALRYFNVFGPRQPPGDSYAAVIPKFLREMRAGAPITVYGDGEQTRDFTYVDNVVQANLLACGAPGEAPGRLGLPIGGVFNIGCGQAHSVNQLIETLAALGGYPAPVSKMHTPQRPGDVRHSTADISRARLVLGYEPKISFEEGLRLLWATPEEPFV